VRITWIGHSCFLLEGEGGKGRVRVITDPYQHGAYGGGVRYLPVTDPADAVTVSHSHPDHSFAGGIPGDPVVISTPGRHSLPGVEVLGVPAFHDDALGKKRGQVVLFRILLDRVAVVHLGDLGHLPDDATVKALAPVDVLLLPVGGTFTVGPREAGEVMRLLSPRLTIPMHFSTPGVDFPIAPVDDFLRGRSDLLPPSGCRTVVSEGAVPGGVLVLDARNLP
jgi:L-ascorbate metabolism protein UlaG (beta-lactamase superfamily)